MPPSLRLTSSLLYHLLLLFYRRFYECTRLAALATRSTARPAAGPPPPPPPDPPNLPCPPAGVHSILSVHSVSTRSTSVLLTENCLLPANNGSTGITRGSPLFIMLGDLVRRLRGLKIRNRLKHFSLRRNSLLSSHSTRIPFVLYAASVSKNGWRRGKESISTRRI